MNNLNMMNAMVVVIENGLPTCISFMEDIKRKGIENNLNGWWWWFLNHLRDYYYLRCFKSVWCNLITWKDLRVFPLFN